MAPLRRHHGAAVAGIGARTAAAANLLRLEGMVSQSTGRIVDLIVMIGFLFGFAAGLIARGMWDSRVGARLAMGCPNVITTTVLPGAGGGDPARFEE